MTNDQLQMIELMHNGLKDLLLIGNYTDKKIGFLSLETNIPLWLKNIINLIPNYSIQLQLRREYRHIAMGLRALQLKEVDVIFIFEAYNQHFLILLPLLTLMALKGKEILISLHGNQQFAMTNLVKYWGLIYLKIYLKLFKNIKVINLEIKDDILPQKYQLPEESQYIIPHPIISEAQPKLSLNQRYSSDIKIKIGVIGMIREDKPINKVVEQIQKYITETTNNCEFIIGIPFKQKPSYVDKLGAILYDTSKHSDYIKTLQEIDILIIYYEQDRYYYRTSGVISDAASCGCYIIASAYPMIKHQVDYPVTIGATFDKFEEIGSLINEGIDFIKKNGQDNHWLWREKRTAKIISEILF